MDGAPGIKTWHDVGTAEIEPEKKAASSRTYRFGLVYGYVTRHANGYANGYADGHVTRYANEYSYIRIVHR